MGSIANAALKGDKDMLQMLLQKPNNDVNEKDLDGQTAVHVAAYMGRLAFYTIYHSQSVSFTHWFLINVHYWRKSTVVYEFYGTNRRRENFR